MGVRSSTTRATFTGLLWTAPWWLGFLIFLAVPMGYSLYISFCDYTLLQQPVFTGTRNFQQLAADATFWKVLRNTLLFTGLSVPLTTILAILVAVLMNQGVRGQAFFRACLFLPTVVPLVAAGVVWSLLLNPRLGLLNVVLGFFHLQTPSMLESPAWALGALVLPVRVVRSAVVGTDRGAAGEQLLRYESGVTFLDLTADQQATLEGVLERLASGEALGSGRLVL